MEKEVFIAILVGFLIGLVVTFGVWQANKAIKSSITSISPSPSPSVFFPEEQQKPVLSILDPPNEFLSKESKITLRGSYKPESQIAIIYEKGEKIIQTNHDGFFETQIDLVLGENLIEIYGFTNQGDEAKQILTIVHSTADI